MQITQRAESHPSTPTRWLVDSERVKATDSQYVWTAIEVAGYVRLRSWPDERAVYDPLLLDRGATAVALQGRYDAPTRTLWIDRLARGLVAPNQRFTERCLAQVLAACGPCDRIDLYNITNRDATRAFLRAGVGRSVDAEGPLLQAVARLGFESMRTYLDGTAYRCIAAERP